jgi:hypothetical protein
MGGCFPACGLYLDASGSMRGCTLSTKLSNNRSTGCLITAILEWARCRPETVERRHQGWLVGWFSVWAHTGHKRGAAQRRNLALVDVSPRQVLDAMLQLFENADSHGLSIATHQYALVRRKSQAGSSIGLITVMLGSLLPGRCREVAPECCRSLDKISRCSTMGTLTPILA